jgi:EAL and modified HD-GYP domain-containing signal transduction protein
MDQVDVFVARQAIFDRDRRVQGYELLFRSSALKPFDGEEAATATTQLLASSLLTVSLETLVGEGRAFVNFGRDSLLSGWCSALPPESWVIEILESVEPDEQVLAACRKLSDDGYRIALDDYVPREGPQPLLDVASIVKVEVGGLPWNRQANLVDSLHRKGREVLAEKVESHDDFERAHKAGYDYFQGFFFAKPEVLRTRQIPASAVHCLRLLREAQEPELDLLRLETLVAQDLSFSYKLLRYVNSALFSHRREIRSIRHALLFLGENDLRKWIALAALPALAQDKPAELVHHSVVRGAFCQGVARLASSGVESQAFLVGLFSLIDAVMDRPIQLTLTEINLAPEINAALTGSGPGDHPLARILELALAYEAAAWETVEELCGRLFIPPDGVGKAYVEAVRWAGDATATPAARAPGGRTPRYPA